MKIGIPREVYAGEKRVATTPEAAEKLQKLGFSVAIESCAGLAAKFSDDAYREAGVEVIEDTRTLWSSSDIILKVRAPGPHPDLGCDEIDLLSDKHTLISFIWPAQNKDLLSRLAAKKTTVLAMDSVPRISRAQKMDALSSMANIAGYRASCRSFSPVSAGFLQVRLLPQAKCHQQKYLLLVLVLRDLAAIGAAK